MWQEFWVKSGRDIWNVHVPRPTPCLSHSLSSLPLTVKTTSFSEEATWWWGSQEWGRQKKAESQGFRLIFETNQQKICHLEFFILILTSTVKLVWIKWTWFLQVVFKVSVPEGLSASGSAAPHLVNIVTRFSFLGEFTEIVSGGSRWTRRLLFSSHFFRRSLSFSDSKWQVVWQNGLFF